MSTTFLVAVGLQFIQNYFAFASVLSPCHVITSGKSIRPGQLYIVAAHLCSEGSLKLTSSIIRSGIVVTSATLDIPQGGITQIPLKLPPGIPEGEYKLTLEGSLQGSSQSFYKSADLMYDSRMIAIVIQTSRAIYRASQTVYFRILALQTDLKAYDDALDIYILDSDGIVMKRWLSIFTNNGIASMQYQLPFYVKEGIWTIRVRTYNQVEEHRVKVENYFDPYFEVFVDMPPYARIQDNQLSAEVWGMMSTQEYIRGNLTLKASLKRHNELEFVPIWEKNIFNKGEKSLVSLDLTSIEAIRGDLKIEAEMTDFLYGSTSHGFAITRLQDDKLNIRFITDGIILFSISKPLVLSLAVESISGYAVSSEVIENSKVLLEIEETFFDGQVESKKVVEVFPPNSVNDQENIVFVDQDELENFPQSGVLTFTFIPSMKSSMVTFRASLVYESVTYEAYVGCSAVKNPSGNIALSTSTFYPTVEEFAIFHLTSDVPLLSFQYLVVSKGSVVNSGEVKLVSHVPTTTTFNVAMGPDMAPAFHLVVYAVHDGLLMSDSLFLPLAAFNRYEMSLSMNNAKDHKGDMVEIIVAGDEGAYIAVNSVREKLGYRLQAGNDMTLSRVVNSMMLFELDQKRLPRATRKSLTGEAPDEVKFYPSLNYGAYPNQTFGLSGLLLFTNMPETIDATEWCDLPELYKCFNGGCYNETQKCNGFNDCPDATDERNCEIIPKEDYSFKISRISRSTYLYDADYGDWGWREIKKNDHTGDEYDPVDVPNIAENWMVNAFSVSPKLGFSIIESPVSYSSERALSAQLSGPESCRRGEQVGLRLIIHNHDEMRSDILVRIVSTPHFKFIKVGNSGSVSSYSATLIDGDIHILVYIPGKGQQRLDLPVVPTIEKGQVEIRVFATSQAGKAELNHFLNVLPEGAEVRRHTSTVLDLQNRGFVLSYFDVPIEESPIVPYQEWRRYIFGSPRGSLSITGNLLGPLLPANGVSLLATLDRNSKGTDVRLFEFGISIWTLHYRRVTSTLSGYAEVRERLDHANILYNTVQKRFYKEGYFVNWDSSQPSVWLTTCVLRVYRQAVYADWEYILFIDRTIFNRCIEWITSFQTEEGSFFETEYYSLNPLDAQIGRNDSVIALTAHILIMLSECSDLVQGQTRNLVATAIVRATKFLESKINANEDVYNLAVTVWALRSVNSDQLEHAYNLLRSSMKTNADGLPYWSSESIPSPSIKVENQRVFRGPRLYSKGDSKAVEATSFALLAILAQDGITSTATNIVMWLQNMRTTNGGFISLMDTLAAAQALTEYANRARLVDVTKLEVRISSPNDPSVNHLFQITDRSDISNFEIIEMEKVWGHVNMRARGAGLALVQLQMSYGIDDKSLVDFPPENNFGLTVREIFSSYRNKSSIVIEACTKWLRKEPATSGSAVLEIDIPTGYYLVESEAQDAILNGIHPTLRDAKTLHQKTIWMFDRIPNEWLCFNHTIRRWFAVANMTQYRGALLYETHARESFTQILFNSTPLYALSICEVCGSYQCPYCPYYNSSRSLKLELWVVVSITIFISNVIFSQNDLL